MTDNNGHSARPTRSQRKRRPVGEQTIDVVLVTEQFERATLSIAAAFDRIVPMHLRACGRPGCVDPVVTTLFDERTSHIERLCAKHTNVVALALNNVALAEFEVRRQAIRQQEFDALDPAMQYGLEGR
jgi:hypothetical protein